MKKTVLVLLLFCASIAQAQYHPGSSVARKGISLPDSSIHTTNRFAWFGVPDHLKSNLSLFLPDSEAVYSECDPVISTLDDIMHIGYRPRGTVDSLRLTRGTKYITFKPPAILTGDYNVAMPPVLPGAVGFWEIDYTGQLYFTRVPDTTAHAATSAALDGFNKTVEQKHHLRFTILSPDSVQALTSGSICLIPYTTDSMTVTAIYTTCNADPTTEFKGYLQYANSFIGGGGAAVIDTIQTAGGYSFDTSIHTAGIPAGKCIYISLDTIPEGTLVKQISFDVVYTY